MLDMRKLRLGEVKLSPQGQMASYRLGLKQKLPDSKTQALPTQVQSSEKDSFGASKLYFVFALNPNKANKQNRPTTPFQPFQ